ncbi:hypothetical protein EON62_01350 [archaeon]|nr:MAG: hypothetical protein EON62_01350 [archaeon]
MRLPFGSDPALRASYVNFRGQLRIGKLLEELDAFAGNVAYLHCDDNDENTAPPVLVTVSTDRVDLLTYPLMSDQDMELKGMVTYTGSSSINIDVDLSTVPTEHDPVRKPIMMASLTFVARDFHNQALRVPKLNPTTALEKRMWEAGRRAQASRRAARESSVVLTPPGPLELGKLHTLLTNPPPVRHRLPSGKMVLEDGKTAVYVSDTGIQSHVITMPQDRNLHGKTFGGNLMRNAFETAWSCAWLATGSLPKFLALDDITFLRPVEVGTLLRFDARLVYAPGAPSHTFSVSVKALCCTPGAGPEQSRETVTNTFHFTFYCDDADAIPLVIPQTYEEAMAYVEASRRNAAGKALAEERKAAGALSVRFPETLPRRPTAPLSTTRE